MEGSRLMCNRFSKRNRRVVKQTPFMCISKFAIHFADMANAINRAIEKVATLPAETQERIGEELLSHVEKVQRLQSKLGAAAHSLDHGGGRELKMAEVIDRARAQYGEAQ